MGSKQRRMLGDRKRKKLRKKILEKYKHIIDFCKDIDVPVAAISRILSGVVHGNDELWEKIQKALNIPGEELESYKTPEASKPGAARVKLKLKILEEFDTIKGFCKAANIDTHVANDIYRGKKYGSFETWFSIQNTLNIPDEEMWSYIKPKEVEIDNGKLQGAYNPKTAADN